MCQLLIGGQTKPSFCHDRIEVIPYLFYLDLSCTGVYVGPNVPAMYEMHFVVLMDRVVLNTINSRLDAKNIATTLWHSEAKVFFADYQYVQVVGKALHILVGDSKVAESSIPLVIVIDDIDSPTSVRLGELEYEQLVHKGNPRYVHFELEDEWDPIALNP
jgi:hypothetical protein